jgi:hypothetical protein
MRLLRLLVVVLSLSVGLLEAQSPFSGTWKLNTSKSHQIPPPTKSSTAHIDADEENFKLKQDFVEDKGQSTATFEAKFDGKDYPVTGEPMYYDSVQVRRVNEREVILTVKKAGKLVSTNRVMVSKDGKTVTCIVTDYSEGKPRKGTDIYDKEAVP